MAIDDPDFTSLDLWGESRIASCQLELELTVHPRMS